LPAFLNVPGLDKRLKSHINTSNYHYFSNNGNDQLWIIGLEPGTFGFAKAKLVASLQDGQFSMIMVSYNYDTIAYQNGDFSTYTGTTSVYSQKQKKLWDLVYEKGKLTASKHTNCNSCVLIVPSDPPPGYTDWCTIYPPLCNYYGGGTDGTNDPTMMTMDPGYDAGGGGGTGYPTVVNQLTAILNLTSSQANWLAQDEHLIRAYEIYSYLQNSTETNKNEISIDHINRMMTDPAYLLFVVNHAATGDPYTIWWEDDSWLTPFGRNSFGTWAINYLSQYPNVSFSVFQNQFMTVPEGSDGVSDAAFWDDPNNTFQHQDIPDWSAFEAAFPKRSDPNYDTPAKLYASIGGDVLAQVGPNSNANTCAARVSKALDYSGVTIPHIAGKTFQGSDGKYYFLGAENLNRWMRKTFGCANPNTAIGEYLNSNSLHYAPNQIGTNGENLPSLLRGVQGIYSMVSNNYTWATGHADLMSLGPQCDGGCHFDGPVKYIDVWKLQ
jgi:hypothetical protein